MRLLYVIHQFFPDCHSGTEQYCLAMAREARRRGDEVTVLSLHPCHEDEMPPVRLFEQPYDGFRVVRINHWRRMNPNDVLRDYENLHLDGWFQRVLDDVRPEATHFFHLRQLGSNLIDVAKRNGVRTVVSLMDFWYLCPRFTLLRGDGTLCQGPPEGGAGCVACDRPELSGVAAAAGPATPSEAPEARLRALLDRPARQLARLASADAIFAPSRFLAGVFARNGAPPERIDVLPYGLEPGRVEPVLTSRPRSPLRLGFCGVLSPWKAPHLAIEAVRDCDRPVELRIHGRDREPMFQSYIDGLRARAAGDARIRFMGPYAAAEVAQVFAGMDLLVVPSTWYENTPFVVLEAFAAGVPVLASDLGGLAEIVRPGENGELFRPGDATSLRAAVERVADDPSWFGRLRVGAPPSIGDSYQRLRAAYRP
jgi:glycosyltransferase involved in cell wall biosynthesis